MNIKVLILSCLMFLGIISLKAQVTIGSGLKANSGALLDLKESPSEELGGVNSRRGLLLPRVRLTHNKDLASLIGNESPDGYEGLVVYNVGLVIENSWEDRFCHGVHIWTGDVWLPLAPYPEFKGEGTEVSSSIEEILREDLPETSYPLGLLGYYEDVRGLNNEEYNTYPYTRFYAHRVTAVVRKILEGKPPYRCTEEGSGAVKQWTESDDEYKYLDDGVWMGEHMRTKYMPDNTPIILHDAATAMWAGRDLQYSNPRPAGKEYSKHWLPQYGLLYNWQAASNKKSGSSSNIDEGEGELAINPKPENIDHFGIQGVCPDGWHLPSDLEWNRFEEVIYNKPSLSSNESFSLQPTAWDKSWNLLKSRGADGYFDPGHGQAITTSIKLSEQDANGSGVSKSSDLGGFNGYPAGYVWNNNIGQSGAYGGYSYYWTSSTKGQVQMWTRQILGLGIKVKRELEAMQALMTVRCKRDTTQP